MKTKYLHAYTVRTAQDEKSFWTRIGAAFPTKNGGAVIVLDALPSSQEGQYKILLFPPKPKGKQKEKEAAG